MPRPGAPITRQEAFEQIGEIADFFLVHDRPIHMRTDDSVVRVARKETYPIRRSRGYAPAPLDVAEGFVRLSCGIEDTDDLLTDLDSALDGAKP